MVNDFQRCVVSPIPVWSHHHERLRSSFLFETFIHWMETVHQTWPQRVAMKIGQSGITYMTSNDSRFPELCSNIGSFKSQSSSGDIVSWQNRWSVGVSKDFCETKKKGMDLKIDQASKFMKFWNIFQSHVAISLFHVLSSSKEILNFKLKATKKCFKKPSKMAHGFPLKPPHLQVQGTHNLHVGMPPFTLAARTAATMIWDHLGLGAGKQILDKTTEKCVNRHPEMKAFAQHLVNAKCMTNQPFSSAARIPVWSQTGIHYQVYIKYITCHMSPQMPGSLMLVFIGSLQQKAGKNPLVFSTSTRLKSHQATWQMSHLKLSWGKTSERNSWLTCWWLNQPMNEKYANVKWYIIYFPQIFGGEDKRYLSCHHHLVADIFPLSSPKKGSSKNYKRDLCEAFWKGIIKTSPSGRTWKKKKRDASNTNSSKKEIRPVRQPAAHPPSNDHRSNRLPAKLSRLLLRHF